MVSSGCAGGIRRTPTPTQLPTLTWYSRWGGGKTQKLLLLGMSVEMSVEICYMYNKYYRANVCKILKLLPKVAEINS